MATKRQMCQKYSDDSSHGEASEFNPHWHDDYDVTEKEYINAYYNAFVKTYKPGEVPTWKANFHHYLVEVIEYVTEKEFQQLYFEV